MGPSVELKAGSPVEVVACLPLPLLSFQVVTLAELRDRVEESLASYQSANLGAILPIFTSLSQVFEFSPPSLDPQYKVRSIPVLVSS